MVNFFCFSQKSSRQEIPTQVMSKMGNYKLAIGDAQVKVSVIEHKCQIGNKISEFVAQIETRPAVGFDVKFNPKRKKDGDFLILYAGRNGLIFNLRHFSIYGKDLLGLLSCKKISFVGTRMHEKVAFINKLIERCFGPQKKTLENRFFGISGQCSSGVEVGEMAARVLNNPKLNKSSIEELAEKVGIDSSSLSREIPAGTCLNGKAKALSNEEVKYGIYEAYTCYIIADKLMGMIGA